jgi:hypothetical protein
VHERAPALRPTWLGERELVALAEVERVRLEQSPAVLLRCERLRTNGDALGDRERQREALVVVGVLADQVDAPRGEGPDALMRHGRSPRAA